MSFISRLLRSSTTYNTPTFRRLSSQVTPAISPSINSLTVIINAQRNPKRIVEHFKKACETEQFRTNVAVYERTVRRLANKPHLVKEILEEQKKYSDMLKEGFTARIISLYGKAGMYKNAHKLFDEMPDMNCLRSVRSFNALLGAYMFSKKYDIVEQLFNELPEKLSVKPDIVSYNTLMKALCEKGLLDGAISLLDVIESNGLKPDLFTFNTLLLECYLKGEFEKGEEMWGKMVGEENVVIDIRSYNARLLGLAIEVKLEEMVSLFEELKGSGMKPDVFSYNAMIRGFINKGEMEEVKKWYKEIVKQGYRPDKTTFSLLLPAMCKVGEFGYAIEVCKETFSKRYIVHQATLQQVVDELVKGSKSEEAQEIVEMAKNNDFLKYKLVLSSEEE